jgi:hypothetical protein
MGKLSAESPIWLAIPAEPGLSTLVLWREAPFLSFSPA